jgi:hypothetical protein
MLVLLPCYHGDGQELCDYFAAHSQTFHKGQCLICSGPLNTLFHLFSSPLEDPGSNGFLLRACLRSHLISCIMRPILFDSWPQ